MFFFFVRAIQFDQRKLVVVIEAAEQRVRNQDRIIIRRECDAVLGEVVLGHRHFFGAVEQGFGRDAADVEARPAEVFPFDASDAKAELRRADGGDVSAGAGADDN